ncbi:MAG: hypothetical protein ABL898_08795 [Hyphomicrobiaceae bacterium]|nr:hypothetical protein [Hyphomicrobiaceae bacterium]
MSSLMSKSAAEKVVRLPSAVRGVKLSASDDLPSNWQPVGNVAASLIGRLKIVKSAA